MSAADRLDQIEARANAATEGPWKTTYEEADQWHSITGSPYPLGGGLWADHPEVATVDQEDEADAEFIAHARTDVPALVAALRAVLRVCDATEATPVPGIVITGAAVSTTNIRRAIEEALS